MYKSFETTESIHIELKDLFEGDIEMVIKGKCVSKSNVRWVELAAKSEDLIYRLRDVITTIIEKKIKED